LALVLGLLVLALVRGSLSIALEGFLDMALGGFGDWPRFLSTGRLSFLLRPWGETAVKASLLTLTGLSVAVAFRAGLFNIGAQGQLIWGALVAAVLGTHGPFPSVVHPILAILGAAAAGAVYGFLPALLKARRGINEVISCIMLNWIAVSLVEGWLVPGPLAAAPRGGVSRAGTEEIFPSAALPRLFGELSRLHVGLPLTLLLMVGVWIWLERRVRGWEVGVVGLSPEVAHSVGIPVHARQGQAMAVAGALAGIAGALVVLGTEGKYPASLPAPYGFDGIAIAMVGQAHPLGVTLAALFFGALRAGGARMQLHGIHPSFPEVLQGLALLFAALPSTLIALRRRQKPASTQGGEEPARA
jgi:simple sugar transport system permease protein